MKISRPLRLSFLFVLFFSVFLYLSFPYEVVKELVSAEIANMTGFSIRMQELSPKIPLGLTARSVSLTPPGSTKSIEIERVSVSIRVFSLLIGRLSVALNLNSKQKGSLDFGVSLPLFGILSGKDVVPRAMSLDAGSFVLDDLTSFAFDALASSSSVSPLLQPVLKGIALSARLSGNAEISIDAANPQSSTGRVNLAFRDAVLKLSDPSLGLPDQKFSNAKIAGVIEGGALRVDGSTKLEAEELSIGASGKVLLKKPLSGSELDIQVPIKISGGLREKFGFVIDAMSGGVPRNGEINVEIKGTVASPTQSIAGAASTVL